MSERELTIAALWLKWYQERLSVLPVKRSRFLTRARIGGYLTLENKIRRDLNNLERR